jgi:hypothetical protein
MKIEDCITEPLKYPISICFTESDFTRWNRLREQIKTVNKHAMISELARKKIIELMNELENHLVSIK